LFFYVFTVTFSRRLIDHIGPSTSLFKMMELEEGEIFSDPTTMSEIHAFSAGNMPGLMKPAEEDAAAVIGNPSSNPAGVMKPADMQPPESNTSRNSPEKPAVRLSQTALEKLEEMKSAALPAKPTVAAGMFPSAKSGFELGFPAGLDRPTSMFEGKKDA
jgi:hypothetical protein